MRCNLFYAVIYLILLIISIIFSNNEAFIYISIILLFFYLRSLKYNIGDPLVLILLGVILFNSRYFLDIIYSTSTFGDTRGFFKSGVFYSEYLDGTILYIKLAIIAFLFGMFRFNKKDTLTKVYKTDLLYYKYYFIFMLAPTISICLAIIVLCYINGGYAYFNSGGGLISILRRFIPFITVCLSINLIFFKKKNITFILIFIGLCISLFVGARLIGLTPFLCYLVYLSYNQTRKYNIYLPIIGSIIMFFTVIVNFYRAGFDIENNLDYFFFLHFFLNEISFTTNLLPMSFEYTDINGYAYGINYLGALVSIVPKLAFWMRVSPDTYSFSSALGMFYDPVSMSKGLGLNGSLLGESYFSFGFFGILFIFIFSFFLRKFFEKINKSYFWYFIIISASPYLLTCFIFESTIVFRSVFYYSILPIVIFSVLNKILRK